jgi:hypothetical protein
MITYDSRAAIEPLIAFTYQCVVASLLLISLAVLTAVPAAAGALASPKQDAPTSKEASPFVGHDLLIPAVLAASPLEPRITLQTSFNAKPPQPARRLLKTGGQHISWQVIAADSQSDLEVINEGTMLTTFPDPTTQMSALTDWYQRFRLNYSRPWERSHYGVEYRYVGKDFTPPKYLKVKPDQGLLDLWGMWQFGPTQLRTSVSQVWDNVDLDPSRSRLTTTRGQMQMEIALPALPSLVLSYSRGSTWSSWTPKGAGAQQYWLDTLEATLHYDRPTWQTSITSIYTQSQDRLRSNRTALYLYHELNLVYHPTSKLYVGPAMRMSQTRSPTSGVWTDTPGVGLSLYYQRFFNVVDLTAESSYTHSYSHDGTWDTHTMDTVVSVIWHFAKLRFGTAAMIFEVSYVDYVDVNASANSFSALTGGWSVKMTF